MKINPTNINDVTDNRLKELLSTYEPENPSTDFKRQAMANILHEWSLQPDISKNKSKTELVVWIGLSVVAIVVISFLFDYYSILPKWNWDALLVDLSFISNIESTLQTICHSITNLPSVYVVTIIGGSIVLAIDQIAKRKLKIGRHQHFLI